MIYELWDTESANLLGSYASEGEALADVWQVVRARGREAGDALALAFEDVTGETYPVAAGEALVALAERSKQAGVSRSR